jgi:hypothetical protein
MLRRRDIWFLYVFASCVSLGLAAWGYDRGQMIDWIGDTDLEMDFLVTDADSGQPLPDARIQVRCEMGFYQGSDEDREKPFELQTDPAGKAHRLCRHNWCIGRQSGLRITDTYHVYIPYWFVRVLADGYQTSAWVEVPEEYRGKVQHERRQRDRLTVRISLKKAAAE